MVVKAVIGANYGDEGKGLMTDYFCHQALLENKTCLNVLTNGGAQRGHTVVQDDKRHVFHHFGSGTFSNADTYISDQFVANPMVFVHELKELEELGLKPKTYIGQNCMLSTPYDMMFNRILLEHEGVHNSCGLGIWETKLRYYYTSFPRYVNIINLGDKSIANYLKGIRDGYYEKRFGDKGIIISSEWKDIFYSDGIIEHYIEDLRSMQRYTSIVYEPYNLYHDSYHNGYIVFENAQGLLLDDPKDEANSTPSRTGLKSVEIEINRAHIEHLISRMEVCYVSRKYLTRHGDGPFPEECSKYELGNDVEDNTNVYNECQGHLRYGRLNADELHARIEKDIKSSKLNPQKVSLALTHTDQHVKISGNFMSFFLTFNYISGHPDSSFVIDLDHPERYDSEKLNTFCNSI